MNKIAREFVSKDDRQFSVQFGSRLASSLAGFLAGAVVASILWLAGGIFIRIAGGGL